MINLEISLKPEMIWQKLKAFRRNFVIHRLNQSTGPRLIQPMDNPRGSGG